MNKLDIRLTGTCDEIDEFTSFLESVGVRLGIEVSVGHKYYPHSGNPPGVRKYVEVDLEEGAFREASNLLQN